MKYFIVFIYLTLYLVSSYSINVKDSIDPVTKIINKKTEVIKGTDIIFSTRKSAMKDLKQSIGLKNKAFFDNIKTTAKAKIDFVSNIKTAKLSILKNVAAAKYAKLTTIQAAKSALVNTYFSTKKAQLNKIIGKISTKSKDFFKYILPIKGE